jgi:hypothetical protein
MARYYQALASAFSLFINRVFSQASGQSVNHAAEMSARRPEKAANRRYGGRPAWPENNISGPAWRLRRILASRTENDDEHRRDGERLELARAAEKHRMAGVRRGEEIVDGGVSGISKAVLRGRCNEPAARGAGPCKADIMPKRKNPASIIYVGGGESASTDGASARDEAAAEA